MAGLLIGDDEREAIRGLRGLAAANPVEMPGLAARLATEAGKDAHRRQMTDQTIALPVGFLCTFSVETGHPCGVARHLSVSRHGTAEGMAPHPVMVWEIAELFGFTGALTDCAVWPEKLQGHGLAVNVVQPIDAVPAGRSQ